MLRVGIEPKERIARQVAALVVTIGLLAIAGRTLYPEDESAAAKEERERFERSALGRALAPLPGEVVWEARPRRRLPEPRGAA